LGVFSLKSLFKGMDSLGQSHLVSLKTLRLLDLFSELALKCGDNLFVLRCLLVNAGLQLVTES
jgi:hypothetical protein